MAQSGHDGKQLLTATGLLRDCFNGSAHGSAQWTPRRSTVPTDLGRYLAAERGALYASACADPHRPDCDLAMWLHRAGFHGPPAPAVGPPRLGRRLLRHHASLARREHSQRQATDIFHRSAMKSAERTETNLVRSATGLLLQVFGIPIALYRDL
jgi:hypothetical protein